MEPTDQQKGALGVLDKGMKATAIGMSSVSPFGVGGGIRMVNSATLLPVRPGDNSEIRALASKYDDPADIIIPPMAIPQSPSPIAQSQIPGNQDYLIRQLQEQLAELTKLTSTNQQTQPQVPTPKIEAMELPPLADLDVEAPVSTPLSTNLITETRSLEGVPAYQCEFEGRDIFVGFPCYKATNPVTAFAMLAMALDFGRDKIRFDMEIGDALITHARNRIAHKFLASDAKYLLMIDDDIIPCIGRPGWMRTWVKATKDTPDAALSRNILHRLIGSGRSIIGGAYFGRQEGGALVASDPTGRLAPRAKKYEDEIAAVEWVGTGCLLVHRSVFESIIKACPETHPKRPGAPYNFFQPFDDDHGEDVSFCIRATRAGHQPHIDLGTPVFHLGYKTY